MILKSFGCSFIFGNELSDDAVNAAYAVPSQLTYPALLAKKLNIDYQCHARPGSGNLRIAERILTQAAIQPVDQCDQLFFIINWSYIDRFDYVDPNCEKNDVWQSITPSEQTKPAEAYYRYLHSELRDKLTSLLYIKSVIDCLTSKKIKFYMTYMDHLILDRQWHCPPSVHDLQHTVKPHLNLWAGLNFLEWSRAQGFDISDQSHPLDQAHSAAADYLLAKVQQLIE